MTYPGTVIVTQIVTRIGRLSVDMSLKIEKKPMSGRRLRNRAHGDRLVRLHRRQVSPVAGNGARSDHLKWATQTSGG